MMGSSRVNSNTATFESGDFRLGQLDFRQKQTDDGKYRKNKKPPQTDNKDVA
jgi:hypothetical protein